MNAHVAQESCRAAVGTGGAPHRHHQGGLSGWEPREFPAAPDSPQVLEAGHVVAWNPSGDGWKVEDTCVVTDGGVRPLVTDPRWPVEQVRGRARPGIWQA